MDSKKTTLFRLPRGERKEIYLMGGIGNVLFQLNFAEIMREAGFDVVVNTSLLVRHKITKLLMRWSDHGTLEALNLLHMLDDFQTNSNLGSDVALGLCAKARRRPVLRVGYYDLSAPDPDSWDFSTAFGYFHLNVDICGAFVNKVWRELNTLLELPEFSVVKNNIDRIGSGVVMHVRGGDYKKSPASLLPASYYKRAASGEKKCFVVTDDMRFASTMLNTIGFDFEFLGSTGAISDFMTLAFAKRKILANSTFSWWAAEVGENSEKILQREPYYDHVSWHPRTRRTRTGVIVL